MRVKGQWAKVTGGNHGAIFDGRRWVAFECLYCMRVAGYCDPALRLGMGDVGRQVLGALARGVEYRCNGAESHGEFYRRKAAGVL